MIILSLKRGRNVDRYYRVVFCTLFVSSINNTDLLLALSAPLSSVQWHAEVPAIYILRRSSTDLIARS